MDIVPNDPIELEGYEILNERCRPIAAIKTGEKVTDVVWISPDAGSETLGIDLNEGATFVPLPETRPKTASHIHVAGPSGVGKSTWANQVAKLHRAGGGKVLVVSSDPEPDASLTAVDKRVEVKPEIADLTIAEMKEWSEGAPILVIFDDVEGVSRESEKAFRQFEQRIKEQGRKHEISSISIWHKAAGGKSTRNSLNEATGFLIFPRSANANLRYMLKEYMGIPPEIITVFSRGPADDPESWGRWVYLTQTAPPLAIGEKKMAILDPALIEAVARGEKKIMAKKIDKILSDRI